MAGALGSDHDHVEISTRHDLVVVDVEAMRESQGRARLDIGLDVVLVHLGDVFVRQQNHDQISGLDGIVDFHDLEAGLADLVPRSAALAQADHDVHAAFVEVLSMGMALAAIADDGNGLALDQAQVTVLVVKNFHVALQVSCL